MTIIWKKNAICSNQSWTQYLTNLKTNQTGENTINMKLIIQTSGPDPKTEIVEVFPAISLYQELAASASSFLSTEKDYY